VPAPAGKSGREDRGRSIQMASPFLVRIHFGKLRKKVLDDGCLDLKVTPLDAACESITCLALELRRVLDRVGQRNRALRPLDSEPMPAHRFRPGRVIHL
jgi:hypothetical protein